MSVVSFSVSVTPVDMAPYLCALFHIIILIMAGVRLQLISTVLPTYLVLRVAYGIQHVYQNPPDAAA